MVEVEGIVENTSEDFHSDLISGVVEVDYYDTPASEATFWSESLQAMFP